MNASGKPTQGFVPIKEIRDGVVVTKNGQLNTVLAASTINFALKSPEEQTAILLQYQGFLNSLEFPVQFYVQSRRLDIRPYLQLLEERFQAQTNDLMKTQVREYVNFVRNFTETNNIMSKLFYVTVSYKPPFITNRESGLRRLLSFGRKEAVAVNTAFEEERTQLEQRVGIVQQGLAASGVRTEALGTEELVELFYKVFNPGEITSHQVAQ